MFGCVGSDRQVRGERKCMNGRCVEVGSRPETGDLKD